MRPVAKQRLAVAAVYLGLSILITQLFAYQVSFHPAAHPLRVERHEQILSGQGLSPWTYRILVPSLVEVLRPGTARIARSPGHAMEYGYLFWRLASTFALLLLLHAYLRHWLAEAWAFAGTLFVAAIHPASFTSAWFQPDLSVDFAFWLGAALLTLRGSWVRLCPLIGVASLNREASIFIVAIHAALCYGRVPLGQLAGRCALLLACWAVPFVGLRLLVGLKPLSIPLSSILEQNLANPAWWLLAGAFLGAFWLLPFLRFGRMPAELRRMAVVLAPYFLLQLVFGRLIEARLFLPLTIALLPMGLILLRDLGEEAAASGPDPGG